jgi:phytoene synthase
LRAFPIHSSRRQLYVPLDVMQRHGAQAEDAFSGNDTVELRAALAEIRLRARQRLDAARECLAAVPAAVMPALLPVALVRVTLSRMERRSYRLFTPPELPQWRRQWILWRAARSGLQRAF